MTAARWQLVREILYSASQIEESERAAYVAERCGTDRSLRTEVEDLLEALQESGEFLESPPAFPNDSKHVGRRVGVYQILEEIGRGGMGEVYRAVRADGQFEKEVAVKMVRAGYDGTFIAERFRYERQVLARLEHPNIARLLDGGATEDGIPYLVMELIQGTPIDQYCDQHDLNISARLQLFEQVCAAVQYAHQRLVIHRDIKPGNILVTADGVPKLLDFGIAKIVDPAGGSTATVLTPMTPEYASPEQMRGEPITTGSDVYSLGLVLYVLLTGGLPYRARRRNLADLAHAATETEPERPSDAVLQKGDGGTLAVWRRRLRGDLDTIVLKALRKEPQHRYVSVEQFAEDIRREMRGLPVQARRGSWNYRALKFLRRHRVAMAAATVAGVAVLGGVAATIREARIAAANAQRAERRFNDVRALAASNLLELNDALEKLPASAPARHLLIQRSLESLDKLREDASSDRNLLRQIAVGYERIAALQGRFTGAGVGDINSSLASYRKAFAIRSRLTDISHHAPDEVENELRVLWAYNTSLLTVGRLEEALQNARAGFELSVPLLKSRPQDPQAVLAFGNANLVLGWTLSGNGSSPNTRQFDEGIARDRDAINAFASSKVPQAFAVPRLFLAVHYWKSGALRESLEVLNGLLSAETPQSIGSVVLLRTYNWRGHVFERMGDRRSAFHDYQKGLLLAQSVAAAHPDDMDARLDRDILTGLSAWEDARLGRPRNGLRNLNQALIYLRILIVGYSFRGEILSLLGDQEGARANYSRSLSIADQLAKNEPIDLDAPLQMARAHAALGVLWARSARFREAREQFSASAMGTKQLLARRPADREALNLARSVEGQLNALARCSEGTPCAPVERFQLPALIE